MEHQSNNAQYIERTNNNDSFGFFKPNILMAIDKIKEKKKRPSIRIKTPSKIL